MSFTDRKRAEIEMYIFRKIAADDSEVVSKTMDSFGISVTSVKRYLAKALENGTIEKNQACACGYRLAEWETETRAALEEGTPDEDKLYDTILRERFAGCSAAAKKIWQYTCAEMLNNAIEHSRGKQLRIVVRANALYSTVLIMDDGVGVFRTLCDYMKENGWQDPDEDDALVELCKGKITSDASRHSGEGIFFSSKAVDTFVIWSGAKVFKSGAAGVPTVQENRLLAYASALQELGTVVAMTLENETQRKLSEVFDMYADVDEGFIRTRIPVKEACISGEPVARSQARRICHRLEEFREVMLDFTEVEFMGQGFADELFRVYALACPQVILRPVNMTGDVARMIRHVGRGRLAENVRLEP
ncbi:MAG: STAS-like domain-containing protein [Bacteroidales bacterium]|nr:STAS-like domain-containing protein [Bacteroidales bacterium]MCM1416501.1 STAS-like domain-containing protein [bacterium]MCM1422672.1 STAS-like domain-containing protein [bacterium]